MQFHIFDPSKDTLKVGTTRERSVDTKFYFRYHKILERCRNPNNASWPRYGGKGIECEWKSFDAFKNDMYASFIKHVKEHGIKETTIDRINPDGNYSKQNCRWATWRVQWDNMRITRHFTIKGKTKSISEWAKEYAINKDVVRGRVDLGWDIIDALTFKTKRGKPYANRVS